jgi:hypothetical protein
MERARRRQQRPHRQVLLEALEARVGGTDQIDDLGRVLAGGGGVERRQPVRPAGVHRGQQDAGGDVQVRGELRRRRRPAARLREVTRGLGQAQQQLLHRAGQPDRPDGVAEVALDRPEDRRDGA